MLRTQGGIVLIGRQQSTISEVSSLGRVGSDLAVISGLGPVSIRRRAIQTCDEVCKAAVRSVASQQCEVQTAVNDRGKTVSWNGVLEQYSLELSSARKRRP